MATAQIQSSGPGRGRDEHGFTSYVAFSGSSNTLGQVFELDSSAGYNFNEHFGADLGLPFYFLRSSAASGSTTNSGVGNLYIDLRLNFPNPAVNYKSVLTGYAPTGSTSLGLSSGRATFDWTNRFDRSFSRLTPFVELGLGNTIRDTSSFRRPYTSLGFNTHFRGGLGYDLWKMISVGAAGYAIVASGQQKIFSRVVSSAPTSAGSSHGVFQNNRETIGSADIAADNGFSAWVDASPSLYLDLELAYTRSMQYSLDTVSFTVGVNLGSLARRRARP